MQESLEKYTEKNVRFHCLTFGCQMNVSDAQWLSLSLEARGWEDVSEKDADVFVVMTCSVREKPEQKVYSLLGRLESYALKRSDVFVAVGGCVAQQVGDELRRRFPFVRLIFGTDGVALVPDALERLARTPELSLSFLDFSERYAERERPTAQRQSAQAFVNIMQGCNNFCSYCIVPFTRGRQKSRVADEVVSECQELLRAGARELTLLGQNVNSYGQDYGESSVSFAALLRRIAVLPGLERLKFTTSHPKDIASEVIEAFGELPTLCPQLHLPVQSGSNAVLRSMGRKYTREHYLELVADLRAACPDIALTTDIIVGFPGESEDDFQETLSLMQKICFASSFSFKYSDRPGTRACTMLGKLDEAVKGDRLLRLQALQNRLTAEDLTRQKGKLATVLVEGPSKMQEEGRRFWRGRDASGRVVNSSFEVSQDLTGFLVSVQITAVKKHSLVGEIQGEPW